MHSVLQHKESNPNTYPPKSPFKGDLVNDLINISNRV